MEISFIEYHFISYPCPKNINIYWNYGFLEGFVIYIQILTGILLGLHYIPNIYSAYYSIIYILREVYFGWYFRFIHSNISSFIFIFIYIHFIRSLFYGSYFYISNILFTGIILFILLMIISFIGYILPWGLMSFWGATVITNLLSGIPCLVPWICGDFYISNPSLSRFFIFHLLISIIIFIILYFHIFYLHNISSNNSLGYNINNKIQFYSFIIIKDIFSLFDWIIGIYIQIFYRIIILSHPDNIFEVSILVTPLHIVPEWYFLEFYGILKAIPNKNAGFMIIFSFILSFNIYGESYNPNQLIKCSSYIGKYFINIIIIVGFYFLWMGLQLPQEKFISYVRILSFISLYFI